ncbi:MAG: type II/IV secretion system protein [Planctomycetes bacterium]|nr:type II/IV secretion system protein [Planctomycetota bacterium]
MMDASKQDPDLAAEIQPESEEVIQYVIQLLTDAVKARASDIHLDQSEGPGRVRIRVDGVLREAGPPPPEMLSKVIRRFKFMAAMDVAERRLPQDGRIKLSVDRRAIDLRICTVPTIDGERLVARILDREAVPMLDLPKIGFINEDLQKVRQLCRLPNGIVIANGPAGSGKTTLLYSMLNEINTPERCIMTVEDPVEYDITGLAQIQISPQIGLTYARAIRSILRQDPDVIMIGELRDLETTELAVQCALTGHLLFTTLHANTSVGAIQRLLDIGLDAFMINASLKGVVSQRLVRVLCPKCRKPVEPATHSMPPEAVELIATWKDATFYGPGGCKECADTGYRGRTTIHEILVIDDRIRQLVTDGADMWAVREAACEAGFKTMMTNGLEKAAQGITSIEEVLRVAPLGTSV